VSRKKLECLGDRYLTYPFHSYFKYAFYTPVLSYIKTFVMMIGEMDYSSIFLSHFTSPLYTESVEYEASSYLIFVAFMVVMSLLLTNLLVSADSNE